MKTFFKSLMLIAILTSFANAISAQNLNRTFSGTVVTQQFELVPNVSIEVQTSDGKLQTTTDAEGAFSVKVPSEPLSVRFFGKNISPVTRFFP